MAGIAYRPKSYVRAVLWDEYPVHFYNYLFTLVYGLATKSQHRLLGSAMNRRTAGLVKWTRGITPKRFDVQTPEMSVTLVVEENSLSPISLPDLLGPYPYPSSIRLNVLPSCSRP